MNLRTKLRNHMYLLSMHCQWLKCIVELFSCWLMLYDLCMFCGLIYMFGVSCHAYDCYMLLDYDVCRLWLLGYVPYLYCVRSYRITRTIRGVPTGSLA